MGLFDVNNNFSGQLFGKDRMGQITPDAEASETLRPFFPVPYPAPYLPIKRQDQGHPVLGGVVLTSQELVGVDRTGAFVPAGLQCGSTGRQGKYTVSNAAVATNVATFTTSVAHSYVVGDSVAITITGTGSDLSGTYTVATVPTSTSITVSLTHANVSSEAVTGTAVLQNATGVYCAFKYSAADAQFTYNALTGTVVAAAGTVAILAAPSDGLVGDVITFPDGTTYTVQSGDLTAAHACTLFADGVVKPVGLTIRNAWQYIGGVTVTGTTGGMQYSQDGVLPTGFPILNFKYEMGIPIQTEMVIRLPWIGATPTTLSGYATADSITGYVQGYGRSFIHFVGTPVAGQLVVAARTFSAGNYANFVAGTNSFGDITGKIIGVQNMYPIRDFADRVRTLWNTSRLTGPIADPHPTAIQMGGSATSGMPTAINLTTDGIFNLAYKQGKTLRNEYSTYVLCAIRTF